MTAPSSDPYVRLGEAIKELRLERGATRNQVKEAADISLEYLGKIEQGKRKPQPDVLARIATALGSTPAELLDRARSKGSPDWTAGALATLAGGLSVFAASVSAVRAALDQRQQSDREHLLKALEQRVEGLSDYELALLVASIPQKSDKDDDQGDHD